MKEDKSIKILMVMIAMTMIAIIWGLLEFYSNKVILDTATAVEYIILNN